MDVEIRRFSPTDLFKHAKVAPNKDGLKIAQDLETSFIKSIVEDNKSQLLSSLSRNVGSERKSAVLTDRTIATKLLHLCCTFDSVYCATSLVNGEFGMVPLLNEPDSTGLSPLHAAASANSARCVEMLLKKHARTDLKSTDGRRLLPLELSLSKTREDVIWNLDDDSTIEDLVVKISEKDLTTLKLLSDKTKEIDDVAHKIALAGRVVDLTALLVVAAEKINVSIVTMNDADSDGKEKTTIYEVVIREALALGRSTTSLRAAKQSSSLSESERAQNRKLMLCEIELLQLFGVLRITRRMDRKLPSLLIRATQAGDEAIVELILKTKIDLNDVDADGNSALHWCLKTFKKSCPQQIKIMWLLLKHGARANQKNKLGMTAVHIAAANGNSQALQLLLLEDPDCINSKTEIKETPLFFAVKNDCKDCAELLLRWGASTGAFNLRKQRSVDLAVSQDMRFMLNNSDISITNRPIEQRYTAWLQGDDVISETCKELLTMTDESNPTDRTCSKTNIEICRYFHSPRGCIRGTKCLYAHDEEEVLQVKQGRCMTHLLATGQIERKIFVGGLPSSVDSVSLGNIFKEQFGSVDDAIVLAGQTGDKIHSQGFGFVTFKDKKSVSAAVKAHHVTIMGKEVEIKSAVPKFLPLKELRKSFEQNENEHMDNQLPQARTSGERTSKEIPSEKAKTDMLSQQKLSAKTLKVIPIRKTKEEIKSELRPWADTIVHGQPKAFSNESQAREEYKPKWFRILKNWLPSFMQKVSKRGGEYALSSLKADFMAVFGLELDHASLGFSKLSDFMKSIPDLCHVKYQTQSNHMILLPSLSVTDQEPLQHVTVDSPSSHTTSINDSGDGDSNIGTRCFQEPHLVATEINAEYCIESSTEVIHQTTDENIKDKSPCTYSSLVQFLKPDSVFHARPWVNTDCEGGKVDAIHERGQEKGLQWMQSWPQERHLVLEAFSRKKNKSSVYFLREFDFYNKYKASIAQGKCFGCNKHRTLWANFPCLHLVWCADCKLQAMVAARIGKHKCVVCDIVVQKIDLISWHEYCEPILDRAYFKEFLPFDHCYALQ